MRIVLSIFSAVAVAFGLLLFMASLISIAETDKKPQSSKGPELVQVDPPQKDPIKQPRSVPKPPSLTLTPGIDKIEVAIKTDLTRPKIGPITPDDVPEMKGSPTGFDPTKLFGPDNNTKPSGLRPVAQIPPQYPETARYQGVEGFVTLAFVVHADGQVADIHVVDAKPRGVFEKAARQALMRWRYAAHNEAPIPQTVTLDFRFD